MVEDLCAVRPEQQRALEAYIDEIERESRAIPETKFQTLLEAQINHFRQLWKEFTSKLQP